VRKLVANTFLTVDGVMQSPGGPSEDPSDGFEQGGWLPPYVDEVFNDFVLDVHLRAGAVLFGRRSYQTLASHWPRVSNDDPFAAMLNTVPKYVASRTLQTVEWNNSTLLAGDIAAAVTELKRQPGGDILVIGSGDLVQTLLRHDLIDVFHLVVLPVLLGHGKRLFAEGTIPSALALTNSRTSPTGVVIHTYERAGEVPHGSFLLDDQPDQPRANAG
jgi:dihydrofolate reductase